LHGIAKLNGVSNIEEMLSAIGLTAFLAYGVYITEIVAPVSVLIEFRTRLTSAVYVSGALFVLFLVYSGDILH
tara:strand:- start:860 stop:1078 length:219 start_codon:yes stop_codon:yes gene_type:complete